jgi:hypothetical protein
MALFTHKRKTFTDDFVDKDDIARRQHPELIRHKDLKPGQWRYDPEFGRKNNPAAFAEEHGYGARRESPRQEQRQEQGRRK